MKRTVFGTVWGMKIRTCAAVTAVAFLTLAASASAEIRTGDGTDPVGDSAGAPSQDLVSASAQYDTNGTITVVATMNGDVAAGPRSFLNFQVASYAAPNKCTGVAATLFGFSDAEFNYSKITGLSGTGSEYVVRSGNIITFGMSGNAVRDRDWSCMTLTVSGDGENAPILDQLDVPMFFKGYGPDTDGDGLLDNADQCPTVAGPAPTGCPPATTPVTTTPKPTPAKPTTSKPVSPCAKLTGKKKSTCVKAQKKKQAAAVKKCAKQPKAKRAKCVASAKAKYPV
jgi:hypothetical protein